MFYPELFARNISSFMKNIREDKIKDFNPNGVGLLNGHFIGLPFEQEEARIVFLPVPWDVTVSFGEGTATGPENILQSSAQLDLMDPDVPDAWKIGHYFIPPEPEWLQQSRTLRKKSRAYIDFLEQGGQLAQNPTMKTILSELNAACAQNKERVKKRCIELLNDGKVVGIVGGDHSSPLGFLEALAERHNDFGVLQIDAHMDLRAAYEGFTYSHASIFHNALQLPAISRLVSVGIRDYCEQETERVAAAGERIKVWYEHEYREALFQGGTWHEHCQRILEVLPQKVYISFDIDGLDPSLCPHTGTPVPGGLSFAEAIYLLKQVVDSGKTIIGFDLCETAGIGNDWDGNVGARILYKMANLCALSHGWPHS